jgi:hypothetical protein
MAYSSIPDSWREVGKAVKKDLVDRIHDNLEDLNGRVTNVEGSVSTIIVANQSIKKERDHAPLGTMVWTPLSEAQFQSATDDGGWELCDGATAVGSDYGTLMSRTTVPDVRGRFLRMRAHGSGTTYNPDGDVATDTAQAQAVLAHTHVMTHAHANTFSATGTFSSSTHTHNISHYHQVAYDSAGTPGQDNKLRFLTTGSASQAAFTTGATEILGTYAVGDVGSSLGTFMSTVTGALYSSGALGPSSGSAGTATSAAPSATSSVSFSGAVTNFTGSTSANTGAVSETRPSNVTENLMIKVNKNYVTVRNGYLLWRAPQALTINQVILTPVTQGTSGTLTVDVKKGPLGSVTTSIFSATPSLAYNGAVAVAGTLDATNAQIAAGDYVRVDITATQAKLQEFHILIAAIPS